MYAAILACEVGVRRWSRKKGMEVARTNLAIKMRNPRQLPLTKPTNINQRAKHQMLNTSGLRSIPNIPPLLHFNIRTHRRPKIRYRKNSICTLESSFEGGLVGEVCFYDFTSAGFEGLGVGLG